MIFSDAVAYVELVTELWRFNANETVALENVAITLARFKAIKLANDYEIVNCML